MSNPENKRYVIQETRRPRENEFIFRNNENLDGGTDEARRFWNYLFEVHHLGRETIPRETLPDDACGMRMKGFRLIDVRNKMYATYD
jgi:hypothetical protein